MSLDQLLTDGLNRLVVFAVATVLLFSGHIDVQQWTYFATVFLGVDGVVAGVKAHSAGRVKAEELRVEAYRSQYTEARPKPCR